MKYYITDGCGWYYRSNVLLDEHLFHYRNNNLKLSLAKARIIKKFLTEKIPPVNMNIKSHDK